MAAKLEEITATFLREKVRRENAEGYWVVSSAWMNSDINAEISVVGDCEFGELQSGLDYTFMGKWGKEYKGEKQFNYVSFIKKQPHNREGVIAYLIAAGEGLGFGRARAVKCWELFGSDAVQTLREQPEIVRAELVNAGLRVSPENMDVLAKNLVEEQALESCTLDLMDVLTGRGFPKGTSRLAVRAWGNRSAQIIRRNPYKLMNFRGCGFKKTDALYLDLKHDPNAIRRQGLCAWYTVARDNEGHTWFPISVVDRGIRDSISGAKLDLENALKFARKLGATCETYTNGNGGPVVQVGAVNASCRWVAEGKKARNEADLAQCVADALKEHSTPLSHQREIPGYPGYFAKSNGTIWSSWNNGGNRGDELRELSPEITKGGYRRVRLRVSTQQYKHAQISHLILETFVGPRPLDAVACHFDGVVENNCLANLRWDSRKENEEDKKRHGTHQTGSGNPSAILNESEVIEIRRLYDAGDISTYKLAAQYGVDRTTICDLIKRKTWSHI